MNTRHHYIIFAVTGTLIPWLFFLAFFSEHGLDIPLFAVSLFSNSAAGGFAADLLIFIAVFLYWVSADARRQPIQHAWLALPLYLYIRSTQVDV